MSGHRSPMTGLECKRLEITGEACDGVGHVTVASAYSPIGIERASEDA